MKLEPHRVGGEATVSAPARILSVFAP
jgi:hypothetical protein